LREYEQSDAIGRDYARITLQAQARIHWTMVSTIPRAPVGVNCEVGGRYQDTCLFTSINATANAPTIVDQYHRPID
jgi:hypothetical protein